MLDVSPAEEETLKELEELLRCEAEKIGLTDPYNLEIRGHSKSYWGKYNPNTNTVILYVLDDNGKLYPLWDIIKAFIHELIHCRQWHDPDFKRLRGIMHNPEFYKLYSDYISRAKARQLFKEVQNSESVY